MKILNIYIKELEFQVGKPKDLVITAIAKSVKNIKVREDLIEIIYKPSFLDPFAGRGIVKLKLESTEDQLKTIVDCQIIPTTITKDRIYGFVSILVIWTLVALAASFTFKSLLVIIAGWVGIILFLHWTQLINKGKLTNQIRYLISHIKTV